VIERLVDLGERQTVRTFVMTDSERTLAEVTLLGHLLPPAAVRLQVRP